MRTRDDAAYHRLKCFASSFHLDPVPLFHPTTVDVVSQHLPSHQRLSHPLPPSRPSSSSSLQPSPLPLSSTSLPPQQTPSLNTFSFPTPFHCCSPHMTISH